MGGVYVKLMVGVKVANKISLSPELSNRKVQRINRNLRESLVKKSAVYFKKKNMTISTGLFDIWAQEIDTIDGVK